MSEQDDPMLHEPIAIVGIGCHLPGGATDPGRYWELLMKGVDATRDVPADRWDVGKFYDPDPAKTGKMITRHGGFLDRIDEFDAQFFGISPREAIWLDPQQRLLLRVAWEALEDGGQAADQLAGTSTGVFIGGFTLDYQLLQNYGVHSRYQLQAHSATGMMMTMLANRLSYAFDFRGPSMAVDTACSGSLVAVHLAVQSIRSGECAVALAGGANVMIAPNMTIAESKGGFLSPDGRCKTFDSRADGYARGEGAAVVVLKRLSQAVADGDHVYALILGTAVTQDGHTNGITVPNGSAQQEAMRRAYRSAGVRPHDIQYVEAHGTGTPVGDPIEARAIGAVVAEGRGVDRPCLVGSVKTNIGHLEAAAGVAGLIKTALSLKHRRIPPNLHLREPNPDIDFDALGLRVPLRAEDWPTVDGPRLAGVNSFGFGGTNAHVVLQEAPAIETTRPAAAPRRRLVPVSARSPEALTDAAAALRAALATGALELRDVAYTAALRRSHHEHRLCLTAASVDEAIAKLDEFVADPDTRSVAVGRSPGGEAPKIAFVCSGMGPQWWAMARELLSTEPVFRAAVERCDRALTGYTGWSLVEAMLADEDSSRMSETDLAQPANFAIQIGLAELWKAHGVEPDAVVGHSTGEVAAQYLSGVLSFDEAIRVVYHRSRLQQRATGSGRMLAVGLTPETLQKAVDDAGPLVSVAAVNSPSSVTLSGDADILQSMADQLETFGVFHRFLTVKVPYHSHCMDPLREDLLAGLQNLQGNTARVPLYSTVTGSQIDGSGVDATYWWHNVRGTVLFGAAFDQMIADGYRVFVEIGPHPVLASSMRELLQGQQQAGTVVASLRRDTPDGEVFLGSLATLYAHGCTPRWQALQDEHSHVVTLPTYPWQLRRFWNESAEALEDRHYEPTHPLLGQRIDGTHPSWENELDEDSVSYLADHRIQNVVLLPAAAFLEMARAAARDVYGSDSFALEDVGFRKALVLSPAANPRVRTVLYEGSGTVEISSYLPNPSGGGQWTLHCTCAVRLRRADPGVPVLAAAPEPSGDQVLSRDQFYTRTRELGFQYGEAFRTVEQIRAGAGSAFGTVGVAAGILSELDDYGFHPSLLDAAFQVLITAAAPAGGQGADGGEPTPYLPVGLRRFVVAGKPTASLQVAASIVAADECHIVSDIDVLDEAGNLVLQIEGFTAQSLAAASAVAPERIDRTLYEIEWEPSEPAEADLAAVVDEGAWLILGDAGGTGDRLAELVEAHGGTALLVRHAPVGDVVERDGTYLMDGTDRDQFSRLSHRLAEGRTIGRLVHLWNLDADFAADAPLPELEADVDLGSLSVLHLLQAITEVGSQLPRLWLVTRAAQPVLDGDRLNLSQAPAWGVGRVVGHQELVSMWGGLIDLDPIATPGDPELLYRQITSPGAATEDQIAFRGGGRYVPRLTPAAGLGRALPSTLRADASYLVTGGLGALGLITARHLVSHGARHLILTGRTPVPPRSTWSQLAADHPQSRLVHELLELERAGAEIRLAAVDVADATQMSDWLSDHRAAKLPPVRGVIHVAGTVEDELVQRMSAHTFQRVVRPKVMGGWVLHALFRNQPLDFFVLYSSTGSVIASPGQANYAAGNAFLDALAHYRRACGLPGLAIGWGPWSVGMVQELGLEQVYARRGIELITPESGAATLSRVLGQPPAHLVVIGADWALARQAAAVGALPAMFDRLGATLEDEANGEGSGILSLATELLGVPRQQRLARTVEILTEAMARVLAVDAVDPDQPLTALGMDSMMAIEFKQRIQAASGVDLSVLDVLQGATVTVLAGRILAALAFDEPAGSGDPRSNPEEAPSRLPDASTIDELQRLLAGTPVELLDQLLAELESGSESEELTS